MSQSNDWLKTFGRRVLALSACVGAVMIAGCERKERVLDIKTPSREVKVDKNLDTGDIEVKSERR